MEECKVHYCCPCTLERLSQLEEALGFFIPYLENSTLVDDADPQEADIFNRQLTVAKNLMGG